MPSKRGVSGGFNWIRGGETDFPDGSFLRLCALAFALLVRSHAAATQQSRNAAAAGRAHCAAGRFTARTAPPVPSPPHAHACRFNRARTGALRQVPPPQISPERHRLRATSASSRVRSVVAVPRGSRNPNPTIRLGPRPAGMQLRRRHSRRRAAMHATKSCRGGPPRLSLAPWFLHATALLARASPRTTAPGDAIAAAMVAGGPSPVHLCATQRRRRVRLVTRSRPVATSSPARSEPVNAAAAISPPMVSLTSGTGSTMGARMAVTLGQGWVQHPGVFSVLSFGLFL